MSSKKKDAVNVNVPKVEVHKPYSLKYHENTYTIVTVKDDNLIAITKTDEKKIQDLKKTYGEFSYIPSEEDFICYKFDLNEKNKEITINTTNPVKYKAAQFISVPKINKTITDFKKDIKTLEANAGKTHSGIDFSNTLFKGAVDFNDVNNAPSILNFEDCIFLGDVKFYNTKYGSRPPVEILSSFNGTIFLGKVFFDDITFNGKATFWCARFYDTASFENTKFEKLADFYFSKFYQKQIFYKTDFKGTTVFSRATFAENVLFTYSLLGSNTIFRHAKFEKGFDLSLAANIEGTLNLFKIDYDFRKYKAIPETDERDYDELVSELAEIPIENKKETFRIFKDQLIKQNNKIEALEYIKYEMRTYTKELLQKAKKELTQKQTIITASILAVGSIVYGLFAGSIISGLIAGLTVSCLIIFCLFVSGKTFWGKTLFDLIIVFLNNISNKYGSNWGRGVLFTLVIGTIFFNLMIPCLEKYPWVFTFHTTFSNTWQGIKFSSQYFFEFIYPFHPTDLMDKVFTVVSKKFYLYDFLGRVFVSYGIYQTVAAFRKYNK